MKWIENFKKQLYYMEITQAISMTACFAGASFGFGYLWATRNKVAANPIQSLLGSGASLQDLEKLDSQIDNLQQNYNNNIATLAQFDFDAKMQTYRNGGVLAKNEINQLIQKRNKLAAQLRKEGVHRTQKTVSIESQIESDAKFNQLRESLNQSNDYNAYLEREKLTQPENESTLELQPLNAVVLKKKSIFNRLKTAILAHPKVAQFVFDCAVFWESLRRSAVLIRYKLSI